MSTPPPSSISPPPRLPTTSSFSPPGSRSNSPSFLSSISSLTSSLGMNIPFTVSQISQATSAGSETDLGINLGPKGAPGPNGQRLGPGAQQQQPQAQKEPKAKPAVYTFPMDPPPDSDTLTAELEEFYSYVEVCQLVDYRSAFEDDAPGWTGISDFPSLSPSQSHSLLTRLLTQLEHPSSEIRFFSAQRLLYVALGTFGSSKSEDDHLRLVIDNCGKLRKAGALESVWEAVKGVGGKWVALNSDPPPPSPTSGNTPPTLAALFSQLTPDEKQEISDQLNLELSILLGILYFMVEVFRGEEEWGDELMSLDPPMPIYLLSIMANIKEKNTRGFPVKKVLLLLWKSVLCTIGGLKEIPRVKKLVREIEGLPPDQDKRQNKGKAKETQSEPEDVPWTKVSPLDFYNFRQEISTKYPTYIPPQLPNPFPPIERIAAAAQPQPIRPGFGFAHGGFTSNNNNTNFGTMQGGVQNPGMATPAPSPPATPAPQQPLPPKLKKQQFQTDQTKPFVLPFSPANFHGPGNPRFVPSSIEEATELFEKNLRVSTELWQIWKIREEFLADDSVVVKVEREEKKREMERERRLGGGKKKKNDTVGNQLDNLGHAFTRQMRISNVSEFGAGFGLGDEEEEIFDDENEADDPDKVPSPLSFLMGLRSNLMALAKLETDPEKRKDLETKIRDLKRLEMVEVFYTNSLPYMQSALVIILKLLLATVANPNNQNTNNPNPPQDGAEEESPPLSLEQTDIARHREITSKAASAILILLLKWFKTSHIMKFHYLAQILVDSNVLLLILKMFGIQEISNYVKMRTEVADLNFFRYCNTHGARNPDPPKAEDKGPKNRPPSVKPEQGGTEELELINDYSWRNFFSVLNFVHILQKLTKRRSHRILLLVQYKSAAILKKILKVSHPKLQLYILKVIKSQVPYYGRKWRGSNMKVITSIYLYCRPDLRDEWLIAVDVDNDLEDALPQEHALRSLVRFFNSKHYSLSSSMHRRASSVGHVSHPYNDGANPNQRPNSPSAPYSSAFGSHNSSTLPNPFSEGSSSGDIFPPPRVSSSYGDFPRASYIPDAIMEGYLDSYEDIIEGLFEPHHDGSEFSGYDAGGEAWVRLGKILGDSGDISDSESIGSINIAGYGDDGRELDQEASNKLWEQINPQAMNALEEEKQFSDGLPPRSPRPRKLSSGPRSPALRPVLSSDIGEEEVPVEAVDDDGADEILNASPHDGPPVDEVEAVFNV